MKKVCPECSCKVFNVYTDKCVCRKCGRKVKLHDDVLTEIENVRNYLRVFKPEFYIEYEPLGYIAPNLLDAYCYAAYEKPPLEPMLGVNQDIMVFYGNGIAVKLIRKYILDE